MVPTNQVLDPHYTGVMKPQTGQFCIPLSVLLVLMQITALGLRIWSRAILPMKNRFQADDRIAFAAFPYTLSFVAVGMYTTQHGFGNHIEDVSLGNRRITLLMIWLGMLSFNLAMTLIRISASLFYRRTLGSYGHIFGRFIWVNIGINVVNYLITAPVILSTCTPVRAFWDRTLPNHTCRLYSTTVISIGIVGAVLDVITLALPLPIIARMMLNWPKKLLVGGVFVLGYSVVVFSIGRSVTFTKLGSTLDTDVTWSLAEGKFWLDLEVSVAFTGACLPAIFALFKRAYNHGFASLFNRKDYQSLPSLSATPSHQMSQISVASEIAPTEEGYDQMVRRGPNVETKSGLIGLQELRSRPSS